MNTEQTERLDELARETALHNATTLLKQCGYNNPQEAMSDMLELGVVSSDKKSWSKATKKDLVNTKTIISKAQAKYIGLEIE